MLIMRSGLINDYENLEVTMLRKWMLRAVAHCDEGCSTNRLRAYSRA
jgi:hypothetical protein